MCEHPREPIYNKAQTHRIISLPNGYWQMQKLNGQAGTRTLDPWVKTSHPGSLRESHALLKGTEQTA